MKKKEITLELVNDPETLAMYQKLTVQEMKKTVRNQRIIDFQEDILRVLNMVCQLDLINLNSNSN